MFTEVFALEFADDSAQAKIGETDRSTAVKNDNARNAIVIDKDKMPIFFINTSEISIITSRAKNWRAKSLNVLEFVLMNF